MPALSALWTGVDTLLTPLAWATGLFSLLFSLAAAAAGMRFFRSRRIPPARRLPPVTILKPLKGLDRDLFENLASFCRLDYPETQLLFTLASPDDPALAVLSRLRAAFPNKDIEVVVSKNRIGLNPKINNLANAEPFIKHELILLSDSDIKVAPDFLQRMLAPLEDPRVALTTAFYRSSRPSGLWNGLEALSVNAHFMPQAVFAACLGMRFAMGAAILVRRAEFERSGGFSAMANHLADDFILGVEVARSGGRIELADCVVESVPDVSGGLEHLRHQVRWARTIRICQPGGYFGTVLLHGFSFLTLKLLLLGPDGASLALAAALLAAKAACEALVAGAAGRRPTPRALWLLPLSEWTAFAAWLAGFRVKRVLWRGELYAVHERGRLTPLPSRVAPAELASATAELASATAELASAAD